MQKAGSAPTLPALLYFQEKDADHIYSVNREDPSRIVYYPTGRPGAGTEGYNSPSPPWAPKPASRHHRPPLVTTDEIISDTQKPLISLHGIRGFIFYVLLIQSTPSTLSEGISPVVLFSPLIIYRSFSKSRLAPASIEESQPLLQAKPHKSSPRPHVWGFFFHGHVLCIGRTD